MIATLWVTIHANDVVLFILHDNDNYINMHTDIYNMYKTTTSMVESILRWNQISAKMLQASTIPNMVPYGISVN